MAKHGLNHSELSQYSQLRSQVVELDESIREVNEELAELNRYNINISPSLTGMPTGNEKLDKIGEFVIKLEAERDKLNTTLVTLVEQRNTLTATLRNIRASINTIQNKQLREIIKQHFIDELSINDIAEQTHMSTEAVYKKIYRAMKL